MYKRTYVLVTYVHNVLYKLILYIHQIGKFLSYLIYIYLFSS